MAINSQSQPFVGREREQRQLRQLLDRAVTGQGSLVLISGEAGIGKTTLVNELITEAASLDALVLTGHCYDLTSTPPYGPWLEILRNSPRVEGLTSRSAILAGNVDDDVSGLDRQEQLFTWAMELFDKLTAERQLVLVLEDLHWSDQASLDFLRHIGREIQSLPILIAATYRSDDLRRRHPLYNLLPVLVRESATERIDLQPLDESAFEQWIQSSYALDYTDQLRLIDYLLRHSEGNPFFASEMLRSLEDDHILWTNNGHCVLEVLDDIRVPMLLRQVIDGRLMRVDENTRELLSVAAVVGHEIPFDLWCTVADISSDTLAAVVEKASEARLIESTIDGTGMRFSHALIRETLYEDVLPLHRRAWHRQVGETLITRASPDPDLVAHHFQHASDSRAATWLIKAGDRAYYDAYALQIAGERYESALALLSDDESVWEQRAWLLVRISLRWFWSQPKRSIAYLDEAYTTAQRMNDRTLEAVALFNLGLIRTFSGADGLGNVEHAIDLVEEFTDDDRARIDRYLQGEHYTPHYLRAMLSLWKGASGRYSEAIELANDGLRHRLTDDGQSAAIAGYLYGGLGLSHFGFGRPDEARRAYRASSEYFRQAGYQFHADLMTYYDYLEIALQVYPDDLAERTQLAGFAERFGKVHVTRMTNDPPAISLFPLMFIEARWLEIQRMMQSALKHPISLPFRAMAFDTVATVAYHSGYRELAWEYINELLSATENSRPEDVTRWYYQGLQLQRLAIRLALDDGDPDVAHRWLEAHDQWLDWSGHVIGRAAGKLLWANYEQSLGDSDAARSMAMQALESAHQPRQPLVQLAIHRFLGTLDTSSKRFPEAEAHFVESLRLANACAAPFERALTLLERAELSLATDDPERVELLLNEAVGILEPLGAMPALAHTEELQRQLESITIESERTAGLSKRELEVLRLVTEGLTDRQVAGQLYISPRTVGQHLSSIYNKLGVNTRTMAALYATEQGLL